jgi:vacuolar-type H+-ATPase subunit E/Vma4
MIKVLEDAVEKIKELPEDRQAYAAEVLQQIAAASGSERFVIPNEHRAAVLEGLDQARRGEFASDEQVDAILRRLWR